MKQRLLLLTFLLTTSLSVWAQTKDLPSFSIVPGQVFQAAIVLDAEGHSKLRLDLVPEKRTEFADFTKQFLNKQVQIVVGGKIMVEPVIRSQILSGSMDFPCSSPEEGLNLAKVLMAK